jgi:hypothetical protein
MQRRRGVMVIVSANGSPDRGFESRQGVRVFIRCNFVTLLSLLLCLSEVSVKIFFKKTKERIFYSKDTRLTRV